MIYQIKQKQLKKTFFGKKEIEKVYEFKTYKEALKFALFEQIDTIHCVFSDKVKTTRKVFKYLYTLEQFIRLCYKNPIHYLGQRFPEKINIDSYYYYLIESGKFTKLKKHK